MTQLVPPDLNRALDLCESRYYSNLINYALRLERENKTLREQLAVVDAVLIVNDVGPRKDGDYRKALHDLVTVNILHAY